MRRSVTAEDRNTRQEVRASYSYENPEIASDEEDKIANGWDFIVNRKWSYNKAADKS